MAAEHTSCLPCILKPVCNVQLGANVVSWVGSQWQELLHRGSHRTEFGNDALQYAPLVPG